MAVNLYKYNKSQFLKLRPSSKQTMHFIFASVGGVGTHLPTLDCGSSWDLHRFEEFLGEGGSVFSRLRSKAACIHRTAHGPILYTSVNAYTKFIEKKKTGTAAKATALHG